MLNIEKYGLQIAEMVRGYVKDSFDTLSKRIDALQLEKGEKGDKGEDGKSVTLDDVKPIIEDFLKSIPAPKNGQDGKSVTIEDVLPKIEEYVKAIPVIHGIDGKDGKDGKDGVDGKSVDIADVMPHIKSLVVAEIAHLPIPENGKDGKDGVDGKDGLNGKDGKDAEIDYPKLTKSIVDELKESKGFISAVSSLVPVVNGIDGKDGVDGKSITLDDVKPMVDDFLKSIPIPKDGKDGADGKDGKSVSIDQVKEIVENVTTKWQLEFERRAYDIIEKAVDKFPKPVKGDKGEDGFGIDSFEQVDARTVKAVYKRGNEVIEQTFKFPAVIDKGVYVKGTHHEQGDGVTFGGSYWIAQKDTDKAPMDGDDWRLAVKRGKDGKDLTQA